MIDDVEARYRRDPNFAALVNAMYHAIVRMELTPTEMREAAMLASIKAETTHPRPFLISAGLQEYMTAMKESEKVSPNEK